MDVMDFEVIKRLLASLEREGVRYAIFGAVALNLHGLARFTEDLDIFVAPEPKNIERLRTALQSSMCRLTDPCRFQPEGRRANRMLAQDGFDRSWR